MNRVLQAAGNVTPRLVGTVVTQVRVEIQGEQLTAAREEAGLSQARLAALCGWSQSRQCQLERPGVVRMEEETFRRIEGALSGRRELPV